MHQDGRPICAPVRVRQTTKHQYPLAHRNAAFVQKIYETQSTKKINIFYATYINIKLKLHGVVCKYYSIVIFEPKIPKHTVLFLEIH